MSVVLVRNPDIPLARGHGATETGGLLHKPSASQQNSSQSNSNERCLLSFSQINVNLSEESILTVSLWTLDKVIRSRRAHTCTRPSVGMWTCLKLTHFVEIPEEEVVCD